MLAPMHEVRDLPPLPLVPDAQRGEGSLSLRYDDVTQDGRMRLEPMTHALSAAVWRRAIPGHPLWARFSGTGILPILSRLRIESGGGPIDVHGSVRSHGLFDLARTVDPEGRVRLRLDAWAEVSGQRGRTHGPPPERAGEATLLGRVIAQHVLTRPFAKDRAARQVHDLDLPEGTTFRDEPWSAPTSVLALPSGASFIDDAFTVDPCPIVFGLGHTDSNQHVNSLVYPRLFEEAALRRLRALGSSTSVMARFVDVAFRKPCFAGDELRVVLRAYRAGDELGVIGALVRAHDARDGEPSDAAHCFVRMQLAR